MSQLKKLITSTLFQLITIFLVLILFRFYYTHSLRLGFLIWNVFLAVCPNILVWIFQRFQAHKSWYFLWLLFFPNSIYLLTDMVHIYAYAGRPISYWFDVILILSVFAIGIASSFSSLQQVYTRFFGYRINIAAIFGIWWVTFLGVYIGRDLRFNSWDVFLPNVFIQDLLDSSFRIDNLVTFTLLWPICISWWFILWLRSDTRYSFGEGSKIKTGTERAK